MPYFADTWFWAALINKEDQHHVAATAMNRKVGKDAIVTTQLVLIELFGLCSERGEEVRLGCCALVRGMNGLPNVTVVPYSADLYDEAVQLYKQVSNDKGWSLVDCSSFVVMDKQKISTALTGDWHFKERGFGLLEV